MNPQVTVFARLRAAKGKGDALVALMNELAGVVRAREPGCLAYRLHRSVDDPDLLVFYETYADEAAFDIHRNAPYVLECRARRTPSSWPQDPSRSTSAAKSAVDAGYRTSWSTRDMKAAGSAMPRARAVVTLTLSA